MPPSETIGIKEIVTFVIAAYGAVLSTFNLIQSIRKERRRVVIRTMTAMYHSPLLHTPMMASIEIVNKGHRPVVVREPRLQVPNGKTLVFPNADGIGDFPKRLEDGESAEIRVQYPVIAEALKEAGYKGTVSIRPMCSDTTGKIFLGKRMKFNVDTDWTKS